MQADGMKLVLCSRKFYTCKCSPVSNLTLHFEKLEKESKLNPKQAEGKAGRRKEIIKIRKEISEILKNRENQQN